jgi:predicted phosphodiesterase
MRIVHISDIHISNDHNHSAVIDALCKDLNKENNSKKIDFIICSGDVANKGQLYGTNFEIILEKLNAIRGAVGLSTPFLLCPGNHDIDLRARDELYSPIYTNIQTAEQANSFIEKINGYSNSDIFKHLNGFLTVAKMLDAKSYLTHPFFDSRCFEIDGLSIGVALLNSTWKTIGGGQKDYGNLFLGERQIDLSIEKIKNCKIKIAVMHHTIEWLSPDEKATIQRALARNFDALLCVTITRITRVLQALTLVNYSLVILAAFIKAANISTVIQFLSWIWKIKNGLWKHESITFNVTNLTYRHVSRRMGVRSTRFSINNYQRSCRYQAALCQQLKKKQILSCCLLRLQMLHLKKLEQFSSNRLWRK